MDTEPPEREQPDRTPSEITESRRPVPESVIDRLIGSRARPRPARESASRNGWVNPKGPSP